MEFAKGWQTRHLFADEPGAIAETVNYVKSGQLVSVPTDTVYGVGCHAFADSAIRQLYAIKQRPLHKAIPVLIADFSDLSQVTVSLPLIARQLTNEYWPGPLTIIVPKHPDVPNVLSADETIAIRVPAHNIVRTIIRMAGGAMAVTSANVSGQPPAKTAAQVLAALDGLVTAVLDAGPSPMEQPSTVVDCTGDQPVVVREGPIKI